MNTTHCRCGREKASRQDVCDNHFGVYVEDCAAAMHRNGFVNVPSQGHADAVAKEYAAVHGGAVDGVEVGGVGVPTNSQCLAYRWPGSLA